MENNFTIKDRKRNEWMVLDEGGEIVAILYQFAPNRWRAHCWEFGERLYVGEDFYYQSTPGESAYDVAQLIELF